MEIGVERVDPKYITSWRPSAGRVSYAHGGSVTHTEGKGVEGVGCVGGVGAELLSPKNCVTRTAIWCHG
jgi:hypothetical protein